MAGPLGENSVQLVIGGAMSSPADSVYVNGAQVNFSAWDMTITFFAFAPAPSKPGSDAEGEEVVATGVPVARLVMSPMHAKGLAAVIQGVVQDWENQYGVLPEAERLLSGGGLGSSHAAGSGERGGAQAHGPHLSEPGAVADGGADSV
jgi:hypothetical protein